MGLLEGLKHTGDLEFLSGDMCFLAELISGSVGLVGS